MCPQELLKWFCSDTSFWDCKQLQMLKIIAVCRPTRVAHFCILLACTKDKDGCRQIPDRLVYFLSRGQRLRVSICGLFQIRRWWASILYKQKKCYKVYLQKSTFIAVECTPLSSDFMNESVVLDHWSLLDRACVSWSPWPFCWASGATCP